MMTLSDSDCQVNPTRIRFARITLDEVQLLAAARLSASAILVYHVLAAHDMSQDGIVWPSIATIHKALNGAYSLSSIRKALKDLESSNLIVRNHPNTGIRFVLLLRQEPCQDPDETNSDDRNMQDPACSPDPTCRILHVDMQDPACLKEEIKEENQLLVINKIEKLLPVYEPGGKMHGNGFCWRFLEKIKSLGGRLIKGQIQKFADLERNALRKYPSLLEVESGGNGEHIETAIEPRTYPPDHPIHLPSEMNPQDRLDYSNEYWRNNA
jgi:hypothetical protein